MLPETTLVTFPGFALFLIVGYATLVWYPHSIHPLERFALAFLSGVVVVTTIMFWMSAVGIPFRLTLLVPLLLLGSLVSLGAAWKGGKLRVQIKRELPRPRFRITPTAVVVLVMILVSSFVVYSAGRHTLQQVHRIPLSRGADALGRQSPTIEFANQHTVQATGYSLFQVAHPEYPLLIPLSGALLLMFAADAPDLYAANIMLLFWAFYIALLCLLCTRLMLRIHRLWLALIATAAVSLTPFIFNASYQYINHFPAAVLYFAAALYLYRWIEEQQPARDLWLSGLLLGGFAWTRIEGLMFSAMALGLVMIYVLYANRQRAARWAGWQFIFAYGVIAFPWYLYRHLRWSADGRLAIVTNSDLVLVGANIALIAAYFAFNLLVLKRPLGQWLAIRVRWLIPLSVLALGLGATLLLVIVNPAYAQPRIDLLLEKLTNDDWGGLLLLALVLPFLLHGAAKNLHVLILPAWFFVLWAVIYVWDFTGTWPNPNNFAGALGSSVRSLLYFYPLFVYAMVVLMGTHERVQQHTPTVDPSRSIRSSLSSLEPQESQR